jgi:MoxR-like ATPase
MPIPEESIMREDVRKSKRRRARSRGEWMDVYRSIRGTASDFEREVLRYALRLREDFPTPEYEVRRVISEAHSQNGTAVQETVHVAPQTQITLAKQPLDVNLDKIFKEAVNERSLNYLRQLQPPENYNPRPSLDELRGSFKKNNYFVSEDDLFTIHQAISGGRPIKVDGPPGVGKAQPLNAWIITPTGIKTMGSVQIGDLVCTPDGGSAPVVGVFPQGIKDIYRVYFSDGSWADCCAEHLWKVEGQNGYKSGVFDTATLMDRLRMPHGKRIYSIPMTSPVAFNERHHVIHPYLMGVLIAEGKFGSSVSITSSDEEIIEKIKTVLPQGYSLKNPKPDWHDQNTYTISREDQSSEPVLTQEIRRLKLDYKESHQKFIPEEYLIDSVENRLELLRGLMDGDGTVGKGSLGRIVSYCTTSQVLAEGVQFLIQSFGGKCTIVLKKPKFTYKGEKKEGKIAYILHMSMTCLSDVFFVSRKKNRVINRVKYLPKRMIDKIEYIGKQEAQCILVDHPDHLYLTNGCVVTHNTELAKQIAIAMGLDIRNPLHFGELFVTPDISKEEAFYRWNDALRLIDMQLISGFADRMGNEELQRVYEQVSDNTYSPRYLDLQVLIRSCVIPYSTVCLVDEIDKAYHEFDNYLLGVVDQNHFIVPEYGRVGRTEHDHATAPIFVLTSNMTRALSGPLVRRCKAVFYDYLDETLEAKVINAKTGLGILQAGKIAAFFKKIRKHEKLRLQQPPSTAEVIETSNAIIGHGLEVTEQNLFKLHGHWIKYRVDYIAISDLFLRSDGTWAERIEQ